VIKNPEMDRFTMDYLGGPKLVTRVLLNDRGTKNFFLKKKYKRRRVRVKERDGLTEAELE
jgi:hypothetical protein